MSYPYSPSKLSAFEYCHKQGKFYEERAPRADADLRDIGTVVHQILYSRSTKKPEPDLSVYPAHILTSAFEIADRVMVQVEMDEVDIKFEHGVALDDKWKPVPFGTSEKPDPRAVVRCVFDVLVFEEDLIEGEYYGQVARSYDYKSGWKSPKADGIQGLVHLLALAALHPEAQRVEANFQNIRTGATDSLGLNLPDQAAELERYRQIVIDKINRAEDSKGEARPGGACVQCSYREDCAEFKATAESKSVPADPLDIARALLVGQARLEDLTNAARAAVDVMGTIHVDGYSIGYQETNSNTVLKDKLVEDWQKNGGDLAALLKLIKVGKDSAQPVISALAKQKKVKVKDLTPQYIEVKKGRQWGVKKGDD